MIFKSLPLDTWNPTFQFSSNLASIRINFQCSVHKSYAFDRSVLSTLRLITSTRHRVGEQKKYSILVEGQLFQNSMHWSIKRLRQWYISEMRQHVSDCRNKHKSWQSVDQNPELLLSSSVATTLKAKWEILSTRDSRKSTSTILNQNAQKSDNIE